MATMWFVPCGVNGNVHQKEKNRRHVKLMSAARTARRNGLGLRRRRWASRRRRRCLHSTCWHRRRSSRTCRRAALLLCRFRICRRLRRRHTTQPTRQHLLQVSRDVIQRVDERRTKATCGRRNRSCHRHLRHLRLPRSHVSRDDVLLGVWHPLLDELGTLILHGDFHRLKARLDEQLGQITGRWRPRHSAGERFRSSEVLWHEVCFRHDVADGDSSSRLQHSEHLAAHLICFY